MNAPLSNFAAFLEATMPDIDFTQTPADDLLFDRDELTFEMDMISFPGLHHLPLLEETLLEIKACFLRVLAGKGSPENSETYLAAVSVKNSLLKQNNMRHEDIPNFRLFDDLILRIEMLAIQPANRMNYYSKRLATRQPQ